MPGLFGGSSSVPAPTTNQQPQAGQAQFYQPQNQVGADTSYTNLLNSLLGQYTGGQTPSQQLYPSSFGNASVIGNLTAPGAEFSQILQQIANNPYYGGAQDAAGMAANYVAGYSPTLAENTFDALINSNIGQLQEANYLAGLPGLANAYSQAQANLAPTLQNIAYNTGSLGQILSGLEGQVAPGIGATQALAGQAAGQIPGINQIASYLSGLGPGLMQQGSPLAARLAALAQRPEGVNALQGGAQNVLGAAQSLYNRPTGAGQLEDASLGLLGQTQRLSQAPAGANALMGAGRDILAQGSELASKPTGAAQLFKGSQNLLNAGYDPQNALRNQLIQQTTDQSNALNAMSGLSSSPYGAGMTRDALTNFNIDWQNQQLGREQAALAGATGGFGGAQALRQGRQNFLTNAAAAAGGAFGEAENIRAQKAGIAEGGLQAAGTGLSDVANIRAAREGLLTSGLGAAAGAYGQAGSLLANKANMNAQALQGIEGLYQGAGGLATQGANALAQGAGVAGTAGGLYGQAGGIGSQAGALTSGIGNLNAQELQALLGAGGLYGSATAGLGTSGGLAGEAAGIYGRLPGTAAAGAGALGDLAKTVAGGGALPGQTFSAQQQAETQALNNWINALQQGQGANTSAINAGLSQYALPETMLTALSNYMKLGQNASLGGGQLGQIAAQNQGAPLETLGSLASGAGLGGLVFGSQGLGGALGLGSGGLLGSLPSTIQDFSSGFGDTVASTEGGSGLLSLIGSLFA